MHAITNFAEIYLMFLFPVTLLFGTKAAKRVHEKNCAIAGAVVRAAVVTPVSAVVKRRQTAAQDPSSGEQPSEARQKPTGKQSRQQRATVDDAAEKVANGHGHRRNVVDFRPRQQPTRGDNVVPPELDPEQGEFNLMDMDEMS